MVKLLELAKEKLEKYGEKENLPKLLEQKKREQKIRKKQEDDAKEKLRLEKNLEIEERQRREENEWIDKTFLEIKKATQKKSGII